MSDQDKNMENDSPCAGPLRVAFFCSRNKDNEGVPGFEQRNRKILTTKPDEELAERFSEFVFSGVPGEMCRLYVSVNARDNEKVARSLMHWLVDNPDQDMSRIESRTVSFAARPECASEKKWMFDYDADPALVDDFVADIAKCDPRVRAEVFLTPNGCCVVTSRGFDTRGLHLGEGKWEDVELKRDGMRCVDWARTPEREQP